MTMSSVQNINKGDIIVERVNGRKRMTPVRKVEFNACSTKGVHVNTSMCYDFNAVVELVDGDGTLKDLEEAVSDIPADYEDEGQLDKAISQLEDIADRLVSH